MSPWMGLQHGLENGLENGFENGDRVRICKPASEYTGCRGTIADAPGTRPDGVAPLGHLVAIDGENGLARPFLVQDLVLLAPARVRADAPAGRAERPPRVAAARSGEPER